MDALNLFTLSWYFSW